jgi:hypothetical protein
MDRRTNGDNYEATTKYRIGVFLNGFIRIDAEDRLHEVVVENIIHHPMNVNCILIWYVVVQFKISKTNIMNVRYFIMVVKLIIFSKYGLSFRGR